MDCLNWSSDRCATLNPTGSHLYITELQEPLYHTNTKMNQTSSYHHWAKQKSCRVAKIYLMKHSRLYQCPGIRMPEPQVCFCLTSIESDFHYNTCFIGYHQRMQADYRHRFLQTTFMYLKAKQESGLFFSFFQQGSNKPIVLTIQHFIHYLIVNVQHASSKNPKHKFSLMFILSAEWQDNLSQRHATNE